MYILETISCTYVGISVHDLSLPIPNFTEDLLGIVIKSVGKENFHSSHIVLRATKMLSQGSPPPHLFLWIISGL